MDFELHVDQNTPTVIQRFWNVRAVWAGALSGIGLAIIVGITFVCLFYVAQQQVFKGTARSIFEGCLMLIASFFITLLAFVMLKFKGYEEKWQVKLEKATGAVSSSCHNS